MCDISSLWKSCCWKLVEIMTLRWGMAREDWPSQGSWCDRQQMFSWSPILWFWALAAPDGHRDEVGVTKRCRNQRLKHSSLSLSCGSGARIYHHHGEGGLGCSSLLNTNVIVNTCICPRCHSAWSKYSFASALLLAGLDEMWLILLTAQSPALQQGLVQSRTWAGLAKTQPEPLRLDRQQRSTKASNRCWDVGEEF